MQKSYSIIAVAVAVILLYFVGSYISDNGRTANDIRAELEQVKRSQQDADTKLGRIENRTSQGIVRVETVESRVETVADRNARSKEQLEESKRIISESQSILQTVRKQKQTVTN